MGLWRGTLLQYVKFGCWQTQAGIVATVYTAAATQANIQAGFSAIGVFPFNRDIFSDKDFAPSYVTDQAKPTPALHAQMDNALPQLHPNSDDAVPGSGGTGRVSPEELRPFPKAGRKKVGAVGRKRRMAIPTDAPVKKDLEEEKENAKRGSSKKVN